MILEYTVKFKHNFNHCKTYQDVFEALADVKEQIKTFESLGVEKLEDGSEDDYHIFQIETEDPEKIKRLKEMSFETINDVDNGKDPKYFSEGWEYTLNE